MQRDYILLDRSGSMADKGMWSEALNAVNGYVLRLYTDKIDTLVTLIAFDKDPGNNPPGEHFTFLKLRDGVTPGEWTPVTDKEASPRGWTPLNDATGRLIALAREANPEKCAIIIMTDGLENASKEYNVQQIRTMLDECRAKNWQIIFLGANFDNQKQARDYGAAVMDSAFVASGKMADASVTLSSSRRAYAESGQKMEFTEDDKKKLATPSDAP